MLGNSDTIIAGGAESMSLVPMGGHVIRPNSTLVEEAPEYYMSMGHTAEEVANQYGVSREDQDAFAAASHKRAEEAIKNGRFKDAIVRVEGKQRVGGAIYKIGEASFIVDTDGGGRAGITPESLGKLRPAFSVKGSVAAGNSSQMSDGGGCVF